MTDRDLLDKIHKEPQEFAILFRLFYKEIFGYIFRRTADFDVTRDVVSETFRKAYLNIKYFEYRGTAIKIWIYRIATNEVNLYFRYKRFTDRHIEKYEIKDEHRYIQYVEDDRRDLETELLKHEQYRVIVNKLKDLPVKYQEVIALRYFENKSNIEIAEILKKNEGTVKSLLSRGLEKLRLKCNEI